jgi:tetratricopeptide (TPR) repeat protein
LATLLLLASVAGAASAAEDDLAKLIAGAGGKNARAWSPIASYFAQHAKWAAAAEAQERAGAGEQSLLMLARYRLNADDLTGAQTALDHLPADLPSAAWLRAELLLARGDPEGAARTRPVGRQWPGDVDPSNLYCGRNLVPYQIDEYLAARIAFARGQLEEALAHARAAAKPGAFPDALVVAANALDRMGRQDEALEILETLAQEKVGPGASCPGVLRDRVLFNEANILAGRDDIDRAADLYHQAIRIADARENAFAESVARADAPHGSLVANVLEGVVRPAGTAVPDARNNLGHVLLEQALRGSKENARLALVVEAKSLFQAALKARDYHTRDYAYAGMAKVEAAGGEGASAVDQIARALYLNPANADAIDIAAMLSRDEDREVAVPAAIQFVAAADRTLPHDWVDSRYKGVIRIAEANAHSSAAEPAVALRALLDLHRGDLADAQIALAQFPTARWSEAVKAELTARRGDDPAAQEMFYSIVQRLKAQPATRAWEIATIRQSLPARPDGVGITISTYPAWDLLALVSPSRTDDRAFPWLATRVRVAGVIRGLGNPLPGTTVTFTSSSVTQTVVTDDAGSFEVDLPPGTYTETAQLEGLTTTTQRVVVDEDVTMADLSLTVRPSELITVTASEPLIDIRTPSTQITSLPSHGLIESLPVSRDATSAIAGSPERTNTYLIDGVNAYTPLVTAGSEPLTVPPFVEEMQVVLAGQTADRGNNRIELRSAGGSDDFRSALETGTQPAATRASAAPLAVPTARHEDASQQFLRASAGGWIVKSRLWVFGALDARKERGSADGTTALTSRRNASDLSAKITWAPGGAPLTNLFLRRTSDRSNGALDDLGGAVNGTPSAVDRRGEQTSTLAMLSASHLPRSWFLLQARGGVRHDDSSLRPETSAGEAPQTQSAGQQFFSSGGVGFINDGRSLKQTSGGGSLQFLRGRDELKIGADFETTDDALHDRLSGRLLFERGLPNRPGAIRYWTDGTNDLVPATSIAESFHDSRPAFYGTATYNVDRVYVRAGLRWERDSESLPAGHRIDTALFQPRLGISIDPVDDGRWKIAANLGRFSKPLTPDEIVGLGSARRYVTVLAAAGSPKPTAYGGIAAIDPNVRAPHEDEANLSIEHQIGTRTAAKFAFIEQRVGDTIEDVLCPCCASRLIGNPGRGLLVGMPRGRSNTTTVNTSVSQRAGGRQFEESGHWWTAGYTWSRSRGNLESPDLTSTRVVQFDPYSRPAFDRPDLVPPYGPLARNHEHAIRVDGGVTTPGLRSRQTFTIAAYAFWMSGEPRGRFGYGQDYGRYIAFLSPRGANGSTPPAYDATVRLSYDINIKEARLQIGATFENLLNRQSVLVEDARWSLSEASNGSDFTTNPTYLQPLLRNDPRTVRFFLRFTYR